MMKFTHIAFALLLLPATAVTLSSCQEMPTDSVSVTDTHNVVVRVADVDAGWDGGSTRTLVNISDVCTRLNFAVYQGGSRVKYENQKSGDADFGTFAMTLEAGTYQLLVVGHSGAANPATTNPAKVQFTNAASSGGTGFTDTFYYYGTLTVGAGNTQASISMQRATAMFRLVVNDGKPANVARIQFYYEGGSGALDATTGYGCIHSKQAVMVETGDELTGKSLQFDLYTFPWADSPGVTFEVRAFDATNTVVYTHEFKNVKMQRNCITRYAGNFFTNDGDEPTSDDPQPTEPAAKILQVDTAWSQVFDYTY